MDLRANYRTSNGKIVCRYGMIDPETMTATADRNSPIVGRLLRLSRTAEIKDAGITAHFDAGDLDAVLKIMRPRIKRRLSAEHKAKLLEVGKKYRFRKHQASV